ncbi:MAG: GYD domain-containing protein [Alphaproteobacteria bacterium]|nr:GYD domain-containing protein [Alphaproteobacteria bacterium]
MALYLIQASYTPSAIAAMIKNPQDRAAAIRPLIEKAGGKLHGLWFTLGESDVIVIAEVPDNTSAVAIAMAVGGSGAMSSYRTTPLMTSADAVEAMKKAGGIIYPAPR